MRGKPLRRHPAWGLAPAAALTLACSAATLGQPLIANGGFEADTPGSAPRGWADFPSAVTPPSAVVCRPGAAGTSQSLRVRDVSDGKTSGLAVEFPAQDRLLVELYLAFAAGAGRVFNFWTREPGGTDASQINLAIQQGSLQQYNGRLRRWVTVVSDLTPSVDANGDGDLEDPGDRPIWYHLRVVAARDSEAVDLWLSKPGQAELPAEPSATVRGYRSGVPFGSVNLAYGRLAQGAWFLVDEVQAEGGDTVPPPHELPKPPAVERFRLWEGDEPPVAEEAPYLDYVTLVRVHRAIPGGYQFLHGPAIVRFGDTLFTSWANSLVDENSPSETMQGRRSRDGGLTWSAPEMIGPGFEGSERHSHGVFLVHEGKLWAFAARFGKSEEKGVNFPGLCTEALTLNQAADRWESAGVAAQDFWPMTEPKRLGNGSWIMPGADRRFRAAVAISAGDNLTSWETVKIPLAEGQHCSETTAWVAEDEIVAIMRNETPADPALRCATVSRSTDFGRTWSLARESDFPMLSAKAAAGVLSTGQRYLVSNSGLRNNARWPLTIAVGRPGAKTLCRLWRIRDGQTLEPLLAGRYKDRGWQYPYAYEDEGRLYVIYSVGKEDCELAIIPMPALAVPEG